MGSDSCFVDAGGTLWGDFGPPDGTHSQIEFCSVEMKQHFNHCHKLKQPVQSPPHGNYTEDWVNF